MQGMQQIRGFVVLNVLVSEKQRLCGFPGEVLIKLQKECRLHVEHTVFAPINADTPSRMHLAGMNDHDIAE